QVSKTPSCSTQYCSVSCFTAPLRVCACGGLTGEDVATLSSAGGCVEYGGESDESHGALIHSHRMPPPSDIVKVAIEWPGANAQLIEIDQKKPLSSIIREVCDG
ncbi:engulfment and cell motility protein 2, partial [Tachysurus ichikawai]